MKYRSLLSFIMLSLLSWSVSAMQIKGGKLISHKEWSVGKVVKGSVKEIPLQKMRKLNVNFPDPVPTINNISVYEQMNIPSIGMVLPNTDVTFNGFYNIFLTNQDSTQKTYWITNAVNVQMPCSGSEICPVTSHFSQDMVTLDPGGNLSLSGAPSLTVNATEPGYLYSWVQTSVVANDSATGFSTGSSDVNVLVLTPSKTK